MMVGRAALREQLAAIEHQRWAEWQRHFHSKCQRNADGSLTVPAGYVAALEQLIETPYADLSEGQKQHDRNEVDRYWPLVAQRENVLVLPRSDSGKYPLEVAHMLKTGRAVLRDETR